MVHRYYDPVTGQFLSVDPDLADTQQPYEFADDEPVAETDAQGTSTAPQVASSKECRNQSIEKIGCLLSFTGSGVRIHLGLPDQPRSFATILGLGYAPSWAAREGILSPSSSKSDISMAGVDGIPSDIVGNDPLWDWVKDTSSGITGWVSDYYLGSILFDVLAVANGMNFFPIPVPLMCTFAPANNG